METLNGGEEITEVDSMPREKVSFYVKARNGRRRKVTFYANK